MKYRNTYFHTKKIKGKKQLSFQVNENKILFLQNKKANPPK